MGFLRPAAGDPDVVVSLGRHLQSVRLVLADWLELAEVQGGEVAGAAGQETCQGQSRAAFGREPGFSDARRGRLFRGL